MKFSVLINGCMEGYFHSQKGLGQGDPVSPFLFLLAMEGLNHLIKTTKANGWIRDFGFQINDMVGMEISHLLYADDSLVFCEAEVDQIKHLRAILTIFEALSGLHVNCSKSCIYPVNNVQNEQILASSLGCQVGTLPTKYLGMLLGAKRNSNNI